MTNILTGRVRRYRKASRHKFTRLRSCFSGTTQRGGGHIAVDNGVISASVAPKVAEIVVVRNNTRLQNSHLATDDLFELLDGGVSVYLETNNALHNHHLAIGCGSGADGLLSTLAVMGTSAPAGCSDSLENFGVDSLLGIFTPSTTDISYHT